MRSVIRTALALALGLLGCAPEVELPPGNDKQTSDGPSASSKPLSVPSMQGVPQRWPYSKLALRGSAGGAKRVLVEGGMNPVVATVQPMDGSFCIDVELVAVGATYTLTVRGQSDEGHLSEPSTVVIARAADARAPSDAKLCDDTPVPR